MSPPAVDMDSSSSSSDPDVNGNPIEWFRTLHTCPSETVDIMKLSLEEEDDKLVERYRIGNVWFQTKAIYAKRQRRNLFRRMVAFVGRSDDSRLQAERLYSTAIRNVLPDNRILPPPIPTGYSSTGVPQYEYWYSDHFVLEDDTVTDHVPDRPFQLIPRHGGRWRPAYTYTPVEQDRAAVPPVHEGGPSFVEAIDLPPVWDSFPGALGSNWYFLPLADSTMDLWDRIDKLRQAVTYIRRPPHDHIPTFILWARALLNDYLALATSLSQGVYTISRPDDDSAFCDPLRSVFEDYEDDKDKDPMKPGFYLKCRDPVRNSGLLFGNYSQDQLCKIMQFSPCPATPKGYGCVTEQVPTVDLTMDNFPSLQLVDSSVNCSHFTEVKFGFQLSGKQTAETMDTIKLQFGDHGLHKIADSPVSMFHDWQTLDLRAMFGSDQVAVDVLRDMKLWAFRNSDPHDSFQVRGLKLIGKCPDSTTYTMDKFKAIDKWLERPSGEREAMVWEGKITPRDWQRASTADTCSEFSKLSISFLPTYGNDRSEDVVEISFNYPHRTHRVDMKNHRDDKFQEWDEINIEELFGGKTVSVRDLSFISLIQRHEGESQNKWITKGFKLRGQCVGSKKHLGLNKFMDLEGHGHVDYLLSTLGVWHGDVNPLEDWIELTTQCTRINRLQVHLGIGGNPDGGTSETLTIRFGESTGNPATGIIFGPSRDSWYYKDIDLKKVFGTSTVFLDDIAKFTVFSVKQHWQYVAKRIDMWMVSSVFFTAECADFPSKWIRNNQHMHINEWFEAFGKPGYERQLVRVLSSDKWFWIHGDPEPTTVSALHDAAEF
ncbi:hypothetical protein CP533_5595 [Ophiocordyceps camponoti-saundersi (nom. inval.)]|nr:hypothetical protein CP533_5595 [Ophiocordyceps camponoti-saundersi (nom. inval.)]